MGYLVLTRYRDEQIMIGDDIEIMVVEIKSDRVKLGIMAPSGVGVHRREVYDAIKRGESREKKPRTDAEAKDHD